MDLHRIKSEIYGINWYPYSSAQTLVWQIGQMDDELLSAVSQKRGKVLDVGAADGELSFHLEQLGCRVTAVDNPQTNFNNCEGIRSLKSALNSSIDIIHQDVDFGFNLDGQYDLAIACGILYHLRNPFLFLTTLALHAEMLVLSSRTADVLPDGTDISKSPVAYLLDKREANGDPTNYWIFSPAGLFRCLTRSGWTILKVANFGDEKGDTVNRDKRTFVICRRVQNWRELKCHHDF